MKNVVIIGATGFGGLGLIELLLKHPEFNITQIAARKDSGKKISEVFPHLTGFCELPVLETAEVNLKDADLVFFSTPDKAGMTLVHDFYAKGIPVIDFSGDFRFTSLDDYIIYAENKGMDTSHKAEERLADAVYGLPELYSNAIKKAKIIGNPGCFAINMILALLPAVSAGIITSDTIVCNGITGVSGAGKNPGEANFYPQRHENVNTYREGRHQHLVEVENVINKTGKSSIKILFVPHLVPVNRGILCTIYAETDKTYSDSEMLDMYAAYYKDKPFVKISQTSPQTAEVRGSNFCKIRPFTDKRTGKLIIVSVIDNLIKGQSGNAVQNANLICGFPETTGLMNMPFYP